MSSKYQSHSRVIKLGIILSTLLSLFINGIQYVNELISLQDLFALLAPLCLSTPDHLSCEAAAKVQLLISNKQTIF